MRKLSMSLLPEKGAQPKEGIACPVCGYRDSKICKAWWHNDELRRTRECLNCGDQFDTIERLVD
jgi:DNA-directed RNA polymerase subunit RPC12/RpoP